ncbi:MAG: carboxypeptidase-like regulatory domain-containing protein [Bacteroidia bacterium]
MKNVLSNRVNMINATITFCDGNTTVTMSIPAFATVLAAIKAKMLLINSYNQIGDGTTKGVTLDTNALRKAMTTLAVKCANATLAFANSTNNNTLAALVDYSETDLNKMKKEDVDDTCQAIHDATNNNIAGASNFGVTPIDVTDLFAALGLYRVASQNPRQAIISKSQAKLQIKLMVREVIDELLVKQLDKMANTLKPTQFEFWSGYKQSREIIDLGSTSAKVRGTVLDENDVPLKDVSFTILKTGTTEEVAKVFTDVKGKFNAAKLLPGDFDFVFEKETYKTVTETNVHIAAGKELKRKIVMDAVIIKSGSLAPGQFANIQINQIDEGLEKIISEAKDSAMRYYATSNPANGAGSSFLDVPAGGVISKTPIEFAAQVGFGNGNGFLNVQNIGGVQGEWKISFEK